MEKNAVKSEKNEKRKYLANQIMVYIQANLQSDLSLTHLEEIFHYSKYYLNRVFEKEKGETIYKYIKRNRMNQAAIKLASTSRPIIDIAYEAGYDSQQAFTQAFQQIYIISPYAYRKKSIKMMYMAATKYYARVFLYKQMQQHQMLKSQ